MVEPLEHLAETAPSEQSTLTEQVITTGAALLNASVFGGLAYAIVDPLVQGIYAAFGAGVHDDKQAIVAAAVAGIYAFGETFAQGVDAPEPCEVYDPELTL